MKHDEFIKELALACENISSTPAMYKSGAKISSGHIEWTIRDTNKLSKEIKEELARKLNARCWKAEWTHSYPDRIKCTITYTPHNKELYKHAVNICYTIIKVQKEKKKEQADESLWINYFVEGKSDHIEDATRFVADMSPRKWVSTNPCSEIILTEKQRCTLSPDEIETKEQEMLIKMRQEVTVNINGTDYVFDMYGTKNSRNDLEKVTMACMHNIKEIQEKMAEVRTTAETAGMEVPYNVMRPLEDKQLELVEMVSKLATLIAE